MPVRNNRYWQVIATYARRPVFRALAGALVVFWCVVFIRSHDREPWWAEYNFIDFAFGIFPLPFLIASIASLLTHIREQLENSRGALVPNYVKPHLAVAAVIFGGLCAAATFWESSRYYWLPGVLVVVLTLMTISAWASVFRSSWFSLLLVPVFLCALLMIQHTETLIDQTMRGGRYFDGNRFIDLHLPWILPATVTLFAADLFILTMLGHHLARLSAPSADWSLGRWLQGRIARIMGALKLSASSPKAAPHRMIHGLLRRAWYRRVPAIGRGAPWWMAAAIFALISLILLVLAHYERGSHSSQPEVTDMAFPLLFSSIVPAAAAAITWRERYNSLGYESLFPARRAEFSVELALAMAADIAEYWVAAMIATILPIACFQIAVFNYYAFSLAVHTPALLASAMMQFLSLGVIFCISRQRSFMAVGSAIIGLILAITIPFQLSWAEPHPIAPTTLLMIALIEMVCGLILTAGGLIVWKTGELA